MEFNKWQLEFGTFKIEFVELGFTIKPLVSNQGFAKWAASVDLFSPL